MLKRKLAIASASSLALLAASILPLPQSLTLLLPFATDKSLAVDFPQAINGVRVNESKRLALVVGVDDYPESPLRLPVRDAEAIKQQLDSVGFEVTLLRNPSLGEFIDAREAFIEKINASGENVTALFFYAGHAVQFEGHNYLIPAGSRLFPSPGQASTPPSKGDYIDQAIDAQSGVLDFLSESSASQVILVLDACRTNPFNSDRRAGARPSGLAAMEARPGGADAFILFAASPGQVAYDGEPTAANSPFTRAFVQALSQPGSSLEVVYRSVYSRVREITNGSQQPYQEGILFEFNFIDPVVSPVAISGQAPLLDTGVERSQYDVVRDGYDLLKQTLADRSIDEIEAAAEDGDAEAQYLIAIAHLKGEGVPEDTERTAYWLRRSAVQGFSRAQFAYGQQLYYGWGDEVPDKLEGFDWWQVAAENGNASAMLEIGFAYLYGKEGVAERDLAKAEEYFNQALSIGGVEAETALGNLHTRIAAEAYQSGDTEALELANERRLAYFQSAAQKGSGSAMYFLADMYQHGDYVETDLQKAVELYQEATTAGDIDAAIRLAQIYADDSEAGLGEAQPEEAAKYLRTAIDLGSETAGLQLADLIKNGKLGVTSELFQEAVSLYEQALADGYLRAAVGLSNLYMDGVLVERDLEKAEQYGLTALELEKTVESDSEDAWPMYVQGAYYNLLKLYQEEGLQPTNPQLLPVLEARVGPLNGGMKRFTVPIICGAFKTPFQVYIWDWRLDESPTDAQFTWIEQARGCEVPDDVVESFQKLYTIARENDVSFSDLTVYALENANNAQEQDNADTEN